MAFDDKQKQSRREWTLLKVLECIDAEELAHAQAGTISSLRGDVMRVMALQLDCVLDNIDTFLDDTTVDTQIKIRLDEEDDKEIARYDAEKLLREQAKEDRANAK